MGGVVTVAGKCVLGGSVCYLLDGVAAAVDVTLLGRFYERFADHAVELAGRVIFAATGSSMAD